jgi:hypothetical protein
MSQFKKGEQVLVDVGVFTASPERGKGYALCEVVEDSKGDQTYVSPLPPRSGVPLYVFNRDIKLTRQA